MDVAKHIEDRLKENKTGIKTYASHQFARSKAQKIAEKAKIWADTQHEIDFIIVYLPTFERWTAVFVLSSFLNVTKTGGYIGWIGDEGFMSI